MTGELAEQPGPEVPRRLGRYTLGAKLGEGGMGVVHRASGDGGREVAIKVLRPHIAHDPDARRRLEREVHTLSRVDNPRIAAVLDADVHGSAPYIVTEFVPGTPLDAVVTEHGPIRGEALVRLGRGLSEALRAIHAVGIVHRDLKPGNVLMVQDDPVVIDFGIAQVADDVRLTMTGMVMGTPGYLSPEVVEGGSVTEATDWWGWAATLAFANSGQPPFGRGPMSVVLDRVIRGRTQLDGVDPELRPLLAAALDPDSARRPHAEEVMAALELYAAHEPVTTALTQHVPRGTTDRPSTPEMQWPAAPVDQGQATVDHQAPFTERQAPVDPTAVQQVPQTRVQALQRQPQGRPQDQSASPYLRQGSGRGGPPERDDRRDDRRGGGWDDRRGGGPSGDPAAYPPRRHGDPRIGRPMRTGTLAACLASFVGLAAVVPLLAWGLLAIWSVVARTTDHAVTSMVLRRHDTGRRRSDVPLAIMASPWHLVRSVLGTALAMLLPLGFAVATAVITASALTEFAVMDVAYEHPLPMAVGSLLGAVMAWWGPGGVPLRRGSRTVLRAVLPTDLATQLAVGFLVAGGLALLGWALLEGQDVSWWPTTSGRAPFSDLIPQVLRP
jgi:serine/threonine protein kinase